jgi:hypothetical protein
MALSGSELLCGPSPERVLGGGVNAFLAAMGTSEIIPIAEVPRILSGKVLEVPVKRILTGTPVEQATSRESLTNPAALDPFIAIARDT